MRDCEGRRIELRLGARCGFGGPLVPCACVCVDVGRCIFARRLRLTVTRTAATTSRRATPTPTPTRRMTVEPFPPPLPAPWLSAVDDVGSSTTTDRQSASGTQRWADASCRFRVRQLSVHASPASKETLAHRASVPLASSAEYQQQSPAFFAHSAHVRKSPQILVPPPVGLSVGGTVGIGLGFAVGCAVG